MRRRLGRVRPDRTAWANAPRTMIRSEGLNPPCRRRRWTRTRTTESYGLLGNVLSGVARNGGSKYWRCFFIFSHPAGGWGKGTGWGSTSLLIFRMYTYRLFTGLPSTKQFLYKTFFQLGFAFPKWNEGSPFQIGGSPITSLIFYWSYLLIFSAWWFVPHPTTCLRHRMCWEGNRKHREKWALTRMKQVMKNGNKTMDK